MWTDGRIVGFSIIEYATTEYKCSPYDVLTKLFLVVKRSQQLNGSVFSAEEDVRLGQTGALTVRKTEIESRVTVNAGATSYGVDTFELADLTQYTSYAALYEEFRIDKIVYSFKALVNQSAAALGAATSYVSTLGMIHSIIDTNDGVAPTSIQTMMNDPSYRGTLSSRNHTRVIYPKFMMSAGSAQNKPTADGCQHTMLIMLQLIPRPIMVLSGL